MPFQSMAQMRFMFARHPDIAKRWARDYGVGSNLPQHKLTTKPASSPKSLTPKLGSETHETWKPGRDKLTRLPGIKRDFSHLTPNEVARHKPKAATESESMSEGQGVQFMHGSRHTQLGKPAGLERFHKRDAYQATKLLKGVKNG